MARTLAFSVVCVGVLFFGALGAPNLVVPPEIYIGEPVQVEVNVADTLIVVNLNDCAQVYKLVVPEPGALELCFVRPCDPPCASIPQGQIVLGQPGDTILFTLKNHPQEEEIRRTVQRARPTEPKVEMQMVTKEGGCVLKFIVDTPEADRTCAPDSLTLRLFLRDQEKAVELKETENTSGVFVGYYPISLSYAEGKFTVDGIVFALPELPKVRVNLAGATEEFPLVESLPEEVLAEIPSAVRKTCMDLFHTQLRALVDAEEVHTHVEGEKLRVVVKAQCTYAYGEKDVRILPSVQLGVLDPAGRKLQGGRLEAGKAYQIRTEGGVEEGCILVVRLGSQDAKCGEILAQQKGCSFTWTPGQELSGQTVAILYLDPYFCLPPALVFIVD